MKVKPVLLYHKTTLLICSLTSLLVTLLLCLHMWFTFTCTEVKVVAAYKPKNKGELSLKPGMTLMDMVKLKGTIRQPTRKCALAY